METPPPGIEDLSTASMVLLGLMVVVGLMLWLAGRRILRAGLAAAGLLVGGAVGWAAAGALEIGLPHWMIAVAVGIVFACIAALAYRLPVAAAMGIVCGVAAPLAVVTATEIHAARQAEPAATEPAERVTGFFEETGEKVADEFTQFFSRDRAETDESEDSTTGGVLDDAVAEQLGIDEPTAERIDQARDLAQALRERFSAWWEQTPESARPTILVSAAAGAVTGVLFAALAPTIASTLVTAFGGSLMWLAGLRALIAAMGVTSVERLLPEGTGYTLVLWLIIALIGVAIQWTFRAKEADTSG
ncbi:MAG: sigma-70 non-essential region-containing protein [Planctomycetes bacterium]|nr:sigma-70 non-essential region-containing protein [Planctomycetota bacterium]